MRAGNKCAMVEGEAALMNTHDVSLSTKSNTPFPLCATVLLPRVEICTCLVSS